MSRRNTSPDQLPLRLVDQADGEFERMVEARAAERAEAAAVRWRFRLVLIETTMISLLVLVSGLALEQPMGFVLRGAVMVGAGCFLTGLMLIGLTGAASRLLARWRRR